jgi:hypothetical protein
VHEGLSRAFCLTVPPLSQFNFAQRAAGGLRRKFGKILTKEGHDLLEGLLCYDPAKVSGLVEEGRLVVMIVLRPTLTFAILSP